MIKAALRYFALAVALTATFTTKLVWEGGKWIARSVRDSLRPPVGAGADIEDAFDDIASKAEQATSAAAPVESAVAAKPAPAPIPLDPILAKGRIATQYAHDMLNIDAEPTTGDLDEAAAAWLRSLNASELMQVDRYGAHRVGGHMAGLRPIDGLPLTPTLAEYRSALCSAAQITPEQRANVAEHEEAVRRVSEELLEAEPERYAPAM